MSPRIKLTLVEKLYLPNNFCKFLSKRQIIVPKITLTTMLVNRYYTKMPQWPRGKQRRIERKEKQLHKKHEFSKKFSAKFSAEVHLHPQNTIRAPQWFPVSFFEVEVLLCYLNILKPVEVHKVSKIWEMTYEICTRNLSKKTQNLLLTGLILH